MKKIKSILELKRISKDKAIDCFMSLYGGLRSSKSIYFDSEKKVFSVIHEIDDYEEILTEQELRNDSRISLSISRGTFYAY